MLVLIEGMDNTGKTTLAKHLQCMLSKDNFKYIHNNKPSSRVEAFENITELFYQATHDNVIADRCVVIGESVYGKVLRGKSMFKPSETDVFMRLLSAVSVAQIFCCPPVNIVKRSIKEREQMKGVEDNVEKLYDEYLHFYRNYWRTASQRVIPYDYTLGSNKRNLIVSKINMLMSTYGVKKVPIPRDLVNYLEEIEW